MRAVFLCLLFLAVAERSLAQPEQPVLPRRAAPGFQLQEVEGALRAVRIVDGSPAARAGLREGEELASVNGRVETRPELLRELVRRLDGDVPVTLGVRRDGRLRTVRFVPDAEPPERFAGVTVEYGALRMPDGAVLRTLVTRPTETTGPMPAIFFAQWVSCDSVEINRPGVWLDVMRGIIERSGMVFIRVERSSGGDSEGPACHELDYDTEVAHYRFAFDQLVREPLVDTRRVYLWGNSLGSTTAPLVAQGKRVAGIVVDGGGAQTYFERMLAFDRIGFERSGSDPREIDDWMRQHTEFHVEYLLRGKDPERIAAERPDLAGVWDRIRGTGQGVHYGRPYAYHRQAAAKSLVQAWAQFPGAVLVLFHEFDQFETETGHRLIVDTVNRLQPGRARLVILPQTGHDFRVYATSEQAMQFSGGAPAPELAIQPMLEWLREQGAAR